ncbi:MAG: hypothetical protein KatS3mg131_2063 [Candidatus Tectimicrobiota bacterium]|nr:MAG: hypothetical protein KatS3mg131_2063 [Candidatus Tectomicrobia bacterium]
MAIQWTHTRAALAQLQPGQASAYLARLLLKSPQIMAQARRLLRQYPLDDERFAIHMIHTLRRLLPGQLDALYEAVLRDLMANKPRLASPREDEAR